MKNQISLMAEKSVIGAILVDARTAVPKLINHIFPEMFDNEILREAYVQVLKIFSNSGVVDFIDVFHVLEKEFDAEECKLILAECVAELGGISNIPSYIRIMTGSYKARELEKLCNPVIMGGAADIETIDEQLEAFGQRIAELLQGNQRRGLVRIGEIIIDQYKQLFDKESLNDRLMTGFPQLDRIIKGLRRKQLIILAARPKVGKSAFALNWAKEFAKRGKRVGLYSMEMSETEIYERSIANMAPINLDVIQDKEFGETSLIAINRASSELGKLPLYINDRGSMTVQAIRSEAQVKNLDAIIIDYLQLLQPSGSNRNASRNDEVGKITRELKQMAMDLNIPVIVLSQLNRQQDETEEPNMRSLRESGSIEQDANIIIFLWKNEQPTALPGETHLACRVAGNRNGKTGEVVLKWIGGIMKFEETNLDVARSQKKKKGFLPWMQVEDAGVFNKDDDKPPLPPPPPEQFSL